MFSALARTLARYLALAGLVRDLERLALAAVGTLVLGFAAIVFLLVVLVQSLLGFAAGAVSLGLGSLPGASGTGAPLAAAIPADQLAVMQRVSAGSACSMPWSILAGVAYMESDFGTNLGPSSAGAYGYGQFMPGTWPSFSGGLPWRTSDPVELAKPPSQRLDSSNFLYALPAMDRYLCALVAEFGIGLGPDEALRRALFYYNHARNVPYDPNDAYVRDVLGFA